MPFIFALIMPSVPRLGIWKMRHLQKLRWKIQEDGRRMITEAVWCVQVAQSLKIWFQNSPYQNLCFQKNM